MTSKKKEKVALSPERKKELVTVVVTFVAVLAVAGIILSALSIPLGKIIEEEHKQTFIGVMKRICSAERYEEVDLEFAEASRVYNMHKVYNADQLAGYCVEARSDSVNGEMRIAVSADVEGKILAVEIFSRSAKATTGTKTQDAEFLGQFNGKKGQISLAKGTLKEETQVREVIGMTVSAADVCDGVNRASVIIGHLKKNEEKLAEMAAEAETEASEAGVEAPTNEVVKEGLEQ